MPATAHSGSGQTPAFQIELLGPEAFSHPVTALRILETHISWIVLTGEFAYKIKKPVKLDFIDASTLERRLHFCQEELRLNRRLAPQLYLNVVAIMSIDGRLIVGASHAPPPGVDPEPVQTPLEGPSPTSPPIPPQTPAAKPVEYAVRMVQFDTREELGELLLRNEVEHRDIEALAELLGRFHRDLPAPPHAHAYPHTGHMLEAILGNLDQLAKHVRHAESDVGFHAGLDALADWTRDKARTLRLAFEARERAGWIRECHGDLHSGNIIRWQGRLLPFDGIDFDPKLRWIDVISDIAFLAMDLTSHHRDELCCGLLNRYLEITGDYEALALLPFYAVYRALVRAKVDAIAMQSLPAQAARYGDRLRGRLRTAGRWMRRPKPALVLMHGPSGSGKSWLSERLATAVPALRVRSDIERKRLAGIDVGTAAGAALGEGIYTPEMSRRTYARLLACAYSGLQAGFVVIVDAASLERADRQLFRQAAAQSSTPFIVVACHADEATLSTRIERRSQQGSDASDADNTILQAQLRSLQPFDADERHDILSVDTREPDAVERVAAVIRSRLIR